MAATPQYENPLMISFRNFLLKFIVIVIYFIFAVYCTTIINSLFVRGPKHILTLFNMGLTKQIMFGLEELFGYWRVWIENIEALGFKSRNYFGARLFLGTFIPILSFLFLTFKLRVFFSEFKPFKHFETIHGDAHWATKKEIKKAGLTAKEGLLLGKYKGKLLIAPKHPYQHVLLFAPTGSGKGVGFVIPNLLCWPDSTIVHDVKLENYELTSGYRHKKLKNKVFIWNPADQEGISHCYNPLDWLSTKPGKVVDDIQKIANFLLPKQDIWNNNARLLFAGIVLYLVADKTRKKTIGEVVRVLQSDDVAYNLAVILDTMGNVIHPVAYMNLAAFLQKADKERSGVVSTAISTMELWTNPIVDAATAASHFCLSDFKKQKHTVYVGVTPDNISRLKPLLQIFYQQAAGFFTEKMPQPDEKFGILMLMDEFPTLGEMKQFQAGIAYFRGYNVRLFLIIQDTEQLKGIYKASGMNSFLSNSTYRITFAANNVDTASLISKLLGDKTVRQASFSRPKYMDLNPGSRNVSINEVKRPLLLTQEVINLPRDEQIILIEASPPIRTKKIFYFKEKFFTSRLLKKSFVPKQKPYDPKQDKKNKGGSSGGGNVAASGGKGSIATSA